MNEQQKLHKIGSLAFFLLYFLYIFFLLPQFSIVNEVYHSLGGKFLTAVSKTERNKKRNLLFDNIICKLFRITKRTMNERKKKKL